ncbi:MAG: hypothetical protein LC122_07345, partial [Chitinophagales bacterium]|nr:hypothetical protein [Chitinophagales bacterium]
MKKVFSSILLIFLLPFKLLKNNKVKKTNKFIQANNNFFMGLLLGALLSLVVNIASVQIQNVIEKQRVLEALENEILSNTLQAKRIMEYNIEELEKNKGINTFHTFSKYNNDIWTQSIDSAKWISQLDSKVQTEISGYYTIILPGHNSLIEKLISLSEIYNRECAFYSGNMFDQVSIELNKQQRCNTLY